ncbi:unnamed protein product (macronuclear) [Paramecium tetraurelia]|uniref:Uncharacterized protein n=1 Tax=Paramecium tetraurelia TaxID=5888 RepID=A0BYQ2_PARTE|nr:uncharacterized protein GSPATT00033522001 [Paramecium tetraurelia]CAK63669.1 unnamed protein product [Paramecium tetraurelia]|eukprot:XP_001431067.1 hypothetical protein (macronuclear) [Paramecium tetraurelia strain d4-2]
MDQETQKPILMNIYQQTFQVQLQKGQSNWQSIKIIEFQFSKISFQRTIKIKKNSKYILTYYCEQKKLTIKIVQTPQTSYRSRLQLVEKNEWINLINQKSQQNLQSDQIAMTEYRTRVQIDSFFQNDWKQPYYKPEKIQQLNLEVNQYQPTNDIDSWKQTVYQRLYQKIS